VFEDAYATKTAGNGSEGGVADHKELLYVGDTRRVRFWPPFL